MKKTCHGSCHCGAVRYAADIDPTQGTFKCNCSICTKSRFWALAVPAADFRLLSGAEDLGDYRFGEKTIQHHFCKRCGVKVFGHSTGSGTDMYAVVAATFDDLDLDSLLDAPVAYFDGRHDNFKSAPDKTRYL
jgi:hypothetical protein